MTELRQSLDQALRTINPGPAPVEQVMRRGKGIRTRRRLTAVAGTVAIVVAGLAGYPALAHKSAAPAQKLVAPRHTPHHTASVTDVPPGRNAARGLIARGMIFGAPWQLVIGKPGTHGLPASSSAGQQCFVASGSAVGQGTEPLTACMTMPAPSAAAPVGFTAFGGGAPIQISVGRVLPGVRYVTVDLSDQTQLKLIPATIDGVRYVAFVVPESLKVDSASAYLTTGKTSAGSHAGTLEVVTAIPFSLPQNLLMFGIWYRPGEHLPPRITRTIATAALASVAWFVTANAGPWGTCLTDSSDQNFVCVPTTAPLATQILLVTTGDPCTDFGAAATNVAYLKVTQSDGSTVRVNTVAVGRQKFFAFVSNGENPKKWTAYNAAGRVVASSARVTSHR